MVLSPGSVAHTIWMRNDGLFRNNNKVCVLSLEADFRHTTQGDLPMLQYCQKMKSLANALGNLDHTISDETLILTILCGLTERFATISTIIATKTMFPSFLEGRSLL